MADVTAPQFQQDVNKASEWSNGDKNTTVTMRLGQQARSPAKVINDIQNQADSAIRKAVNSFNLSPSGFDFATGGTLASNSQTVEDASGDDWVYTLEIPEGGYVVTAGTVPSEPDYKQVSYNSAENITLDSGVTVEDEFEAIKVRGQIKASDMDSYPSEESVEEAINSAISNDLGKVIIDGLSYSTSKTLTFNGASNLKVVFESCEITLSSDEHKIVFENSKNTRISGDCSEIIGQVTPQWAKDNTIAEVKEFFRFESSKFCRVYGFLGTNIRTVASLIDSSFSSLSENHVDGGLTEDATTTSGLTYGWNYMPCCLVMGGFGNTAYGNTAENHGSVVLSGSDTEMLVNINNKGKNLHDNNVYVSSGKGCVSLANSSKQVSGSNVKSRGSANINIANAGNDASVSIDTSGNGVAADSQGANGSANLTAFNTSLNSRGHDFRLVKQDNLPLRHSMLAFNASDGHLGSGAFSPILVAAQKSCGVFGNITGGTSADSVVSVTGVDSSSYGNGHIVALNISNGDNKSTEFNDNDNVIYALNQEDTTSGSEIRNVDYGLFIGNMNKGGVGITASSSFPSSNLLISYNFGTQSISSGQTNILAEGNFSSSYNYPAATTPFKAGIISWSGNDPHLSVPDGLGGFEFKELQTV